VDLDHTPPPNYNAEDVSDWGCADLIAEYFSLFGAQGSPEFRLVRAEMELRGLFDLSLVC